MSNEQQPKPMTHEEIEAVRLHREAEEWARKQQAPSPQHPMTAEQINDAWRRADDSRGAQAHLSGDVFAIIESHNSLLDEVKRWKAQSRYEYELSCKYQDQARERETELKRMLSATQADRDRVGGTLVIERDMSDRLKAEVQRQQGEVERLTAEIERLTTERVEMREEYVRFRSNLRAERDRLQAENDQLRESVQNWADAAAGWESQAEQIRQRLEDAVEALRRIETESMDSSLTASNALEEIERLKGDRTDG